MPRRCGCRYHYRSNLLVLRILLSTAEPSQRRQLRRIRLLQPHACINGHSANDAACGTFRIPMLFPGLRRFVYSSTRVRAAGRSYCV